MAMGECSAYSSLQADSKIKFAAWPTSWRPPSADRLLSRLKFDTGMGIAVIPWGWGQRLRYTRDDGDKVLPTDSRNQNRTGPM